MLHEVVRVKHDNHYGRQPLEAAGFLDRDSRSAQCAGDRHDWQSTISEDIESRRQKFKAFLRKRQCRRSVVGVPRRHETMNAVAECRFQVLHSFPDQTRLFRRLKPGEFGAAAARVIAAMTVGVSMQSDFNDAASYGVE